MKYRITGESMVFEGKTLHRIEAVDGCRGLAPGQRGGWIENENILSQEGLCWVADEAKAYGNAHVTGDARMYDGAVLADAELREHAAMKGEARVDNGAAVGGFAVISEAGHVSGDVIVTLPAVITQKVTKQPRAIEGLFYRITIMDDHIRLGRDECGWTPSFEEFQATTERELLEIDNRKAVDFYRQNRDWLYAFCMLHASGDLKGPDR